MHFGLVVLPAYIIEELRRREQARREQPQPQVELPLPPRRERPSQAPGERGVAIIEVWG